MNILVLNFGSSTVKYELFSMNQSKWSVLARGMLERHGSEIFILTHKSMDREKVKETFQSVENSATVKIIINALTNPDYGIIKDTKEIGAVGHRVVHGGDKFSKSALVTREVKADIMECIAYAPLHNPHHLKGIEIAEDCLPNIPHVVVFDTAFHHTMPPKAFLYALPYSLYKKYKIRRYGFHGTSHFYVSHRAAEILKKPLQKLKIITCHLGNGASLAAIDGGRSVDTSMGLTPLEGLCMGTRCGSIDPSIPGLLMSMESLTPSQLDNMLNRYSGLLGISGTSNDMKDILAGVKKGGHRAKLAFDVFCYIVRKYIASYAGALGGLDALVFTAGIGENSPDVRQASTEGLEFMGVELDLQKNRSVIGREGVISTGRSRVKVLCIPTDEQLVIARDTYRIAMQSKKHK